jgi:6-pyruvoyltetrahydropterin/6-carboxytetrahydropterin synthase
MPTFVLFCAEFTMPLILSKKFSFEAAHHLPGFPDGHKCRRLHGHSFKIEVNLAGEVNPQTGVVKDFGEIKKIVKPIVDSLDHQYLNELGDQWNEPLLKNPTSENLSKWLFDKIRPSMPELFSVTLSETCTSRCIYTEPYEE